MCCIVPILLSNWNSNPAINAARHDGEDYLKDKQWGFRACGESVYGNQFIVLKGKSECNRTYEEHYIATRLWGILGRAI